MDEALKTKMKKAYDLAYFYEDNGGHCSQSTVRALMDVYGIEDNQIFRALGTVAGGGGLEGDSGCGAYIAASFFFGLTYGLNIEDTDTDNPELKNGGDEVNKLVKILHDRFIDEYGSIICNQIHRKLYHRPFYIGTEEEHKIMADFVGRNKKSPDFIWCAHVCGNAASWAVEIFEEYKKNH